MSRQQPPVDVDGGNISSSAKSPHTAPIPSPTPTPTPTPIPTPIPTRTPNLHSPNNLDPRDPNPPTPTGGKRRRGERRPAEGVCRAADLQRVLGVDDGALLVLGIDEAGRGPVFGPMVYAGAVIALHAHDRLLAECGVADSKALSAAQRDEARRRLQGLPSFRSFVVVLSAEEIAAAMTGRDGRNLNTLSHDAAMRIISMATLDGLGKLCAAYVDTVGPPEAYQSRLSGRFPHLDITVAAKADSKYPIVSAASILAKTARDEAIERLGLDLGSGYPSDPRAIGWLHSHVHRFFIVPRRYNFVRYSWGPVAQLGKNPVVCIEATFKQDEVNEERKRPRADTNRRQPKLDFVKAPPKRAAIFTHMLKLEPIQSIGF